MNGEHTSNLRPPPLRPRLWEHTNGSPLPPRERVADDTLATQVVDTGRKTFTLTRRRNAGACWASYRAPFSITRRNSR